MRQFKRLSDGAEIKDLKEYLSLNYQEGITNIYIGSDSQTVGTKTNLATVIVMHHGNSGGHVIYSRTSSPEIKDRFSRLWLEVVASIETAQFIKEECGIAVRFVDFDLNEDPVYHSNSVLRAALGYASSMGFEARWKPYSPYAISVADSLCR